MRKTRYYISILAAVCTSFSLNGKEVIDSLSQNPVPLELSGLKAVTDSLIRIYKFKEATGIFEEAKARTDSLGALLIDEAMVQAQNGNSMTEFCSNPVTVARERFSTNDFFLYYPLQDRSWRAVPNQLDSSARNEFAQAIYVPDGEKRIFWSAKDQEGIRNIYRSEFQDSLWSAPELLNEQMTSSSDEIYPMLSPDGKQLFFASKGLYGMGGYDLYVSTWDDNLEDWGVPVNMGFPYSSPFDDFLYINTSDGKYTIFASNRNCPSDSVDIYVLEYDSMPIRKAITDPAELAELCRLDPDNDPSRIDNDSAVADDVKDNDEMRRYSQLMQHVRMLRDSIYQYTTNGNADKTRIPVLQDSLSKATKTLQQIEMGFLKSGVVIDPEKLQQEADREVVGVSSGYTFSKKNMGAPLHLDMAKPKPSFDYTLQILPEGRFAENNTLPDGLIYQIQLFAMSGKATVKQLRGLSPVFERSGAGGKTVYSAGLFYNYKDVLSNLNKVKKAGFRNAYIVAFMDGKSITVPKARALEKTIHEMFQIRIFPENGSSLTEAQLTAVKAITSADMSRSTEGGIVSFIIGPFDSKSDGEAVLSALNNAGISNTRIESAGRSSISK